MSIAVYQRITAGNFTPASLDGFVRRQEVRECWRRVEGQWTLLPIAYVEDWDLEARRKRAEIILRSIREGGLAYGAWDHGRLAGFARLDPVRFGSQSQYVDLAQFHVSLPYRGRGIGRRLFSMACAGARELGASRLYISAHSSEESQRFYRRMGCVEAKEIDPHLYELEPCDCHLEIRTGYHALSGADQKL